MLLFRPFPRVFFLKNLAGITSEAFRLKYNPSIKGVSEEMLQWYLKFGVHDEIHGEKYARRGQFDAFAELSFPDADPEHLKTCLAFFYWAFSTDDLSDEGDLQAKPERVMDSINKCRQALYNLGETPSYPYASMLQDLFISIKATATPGTCNRFIRAYEAFSESQIMQSRQRSRNTILPVGDFIALRRSTIGAALVEAMVEYSLDINLPDYVFENEVVKALSDATTDIMTWPNDLCSFNKEQADNDFQNLVCCIMVEQNIELQAALNVLTDMLEARVHEYLALKKSLPSFGDTVDLQLSKYLSALENFVQGTVVWYYLSPREKLVSRRLVPMSVYWLASLHVTV
ncbi:terpenoid synthase [Agrocybe pediades]|nr:terpenoid synthase [Agrocybe pediades]